MGIDVMKTPKMLEKFAEGTPIEIFSGTDRNEKPIAVVLQRRCLEQDHIGTFFHYDRERNPIATAIQGKEGHDMRGRSLQSESDGVDFIEISAYGKALRTINDKQNGYQTKVEHFDFSNRKRLNEKLKELVPKHKIE